MNETQNSNQALQEFNSPEFGQIRTSGTSEQPLFCLIDVAKALDYSNPAKAVIDHCKGVTILETPTNGGIQNVKFGSEAEVYRLIMKAKTKKAEAFQDWVCGEVLPTIRRTGGYTIPQTYADALALAAEQAKTLELQAAELKEAKQHIAIAEEVIEQNERTIAEQEPKVRFADSVSASKDSVLVAELAKILTQKGFQIGQNRLFKLMREDGFLCKSGAYYNQPTQRAAEMGLFELQKGCVSDSYGETHAYTTAKVTGKGLQYFVNFYLKNPKTA